MGELEGCRATPSTVSPQAPPASCPSPAPGDRQSARGAPSSPPVSALLLQDSAAKEMLTRASQSQQMVPLLGAVRHLGNNADCLTSLLLVPFLLEVGVQGSGVFPVLLVGLGGGLRRLRTGLIS